MERILDPVAKPHIALHCCHLFQCPHCWPLCPPPSSAGLPEEFLGHVVNRDLAPLPPACRSSEYLLLGCWGSSATAGGGPYGVWAPQPWAGITRSCSLRRGAQLLSCQIAQHLEGRSQRDSRVAPGPCIILRALEGQAGPWLLVPFSSCSYSAVGEGACPPRLAKTEINQLIKMTMRWPEDITMRDRVNSLEWNIPWEGESPDLTPGCENQQTLVQFTCPSPEAASWDSGFGVSFMADLLHLIPYIPTSSRPDKHQGSWRAPVLSVKAVAMIRSTKTHHLDSDRSALESLMRKTFFLPQV